MIMLFLLNLKNKVKKGFNVIGLNGHDFTLKKQINVIIFLLSLKVFIVLCQVVMKDIVNL